MFNNLLELITTMPDEKACKEYFIKQRWPDGVHCVYCGCAKVYSIENGTRYKCSNKECYKRFSCMTKTIFQASNIPLKKWFMAMYLFTAHKKGISSHQLAKDISVTQKSSWFMLHRIRKMMQAKHDNMLDKIVEVDESWTGGKMKNKHVSKRKFAHDNNLSHVDNKTGFVGFLQREGELKLKVWDQSKTLKDQVKENVKPKAVVFTDGYSAYLGLDKYFEKHEAVNHKQDEFVRANIHTNSIEGSFGLFKRMVYGIYHQISPEHLQAYLNEFTYRYNSRKIKDAERFNISLKKVECRLDYKTLTRKKK